MHCLGKKQISIHEGIAGMHNDQHTDDQTLSRAFRDTALSLIGLYEIFGVTPDLSAATAEVLAAVFRRYLLQAPRGGCGGGHERLHELADQLAIDPGFRRPRSRRS